MSEEKESVSSDLQEAVNNKFLEEELGLRNYMKNAPINPMQAELNAVKDELYRTHQQLNKAMALAELFSRQLVELSKSSILKSMSK